MKFLVIALVAVAVAAIRVTLYRARRRRGAAPVAAPTGDAAGVETAPATRAGLDAVGLIAWREITERVRGRIFRVGTLLLLAVVAAAIIIPTLHHSSGADRQPIGVVGALPATVEETVVAVGKVDGDAVSFLPERSLAAAKSALASGTIAFAVVDAGEVLLEEPASDASSPADATLVQEVAAYLGLLESAEAAGLTPAQAAAVSRTAPAPVRTVRPGPKSSPPTVPVIGIVMLFVMLTQYCTWILIGVMQEKSSRVVEVLLAAVRPIQLLGGKVLGIGLVALGQAILVVGFALALAQGVGSDLLKGDAPVALLAELCWLVLGYAFYCWVYAAAGSMAERQDQVQTLALPLSVPILAGYILSLTVASTGNPDLFFKVLAYLPPTAPFCMSVLVGLGQAKWYEFVAAALISLAGTAVAAVVAARIYRRAVLRTGARVHLRDLIAAGRRA